MTLNVEKNDHQYNHQEYEKYARGLVEKTKCYEVILSTKDRIKCDSDELQRVIEGIKTGSMIKLKQGFINPSFIVTIVLDEDRFKEFANEVYSVLDFNHQSSNFSSADPLSRGRFKEFPQFKSLKDIFEDTKLISGEIKPALPSAKSE